MTPAKNTMDIPLSSSDTDFIWSDRNRRYGAHSPWDFQGTSLISVLQHAHAGNPKYIALYQRHPDVMFHIYIWQQMFHQLPASIDMLGAPKNILTQSGKNIIRSVHQYKYDINEYLDDNVSARYNLLSWFQHIAIDDDFLLQHPPSPDIVRHQSNLILLYRNVIDRMDISYQVQYRHELYNLMCKYEKAMSELDYRTQHKAFSDVAHIYASLQQYKDLLCAHGKHLISSLLDRLPSNQPEQRTRMLRLFAQYILPELESQSVDNDLLAIQMAVLLHSISMSDCDQTTQSCFEQWRVNAPESLHMFVQNALSVQSSFQATQVSGVNIVQQLYDTYRVRNLAVSNDDLQM